MQLYPGRDTFEFDQGHVTKNQAITALVLLSESLGVQQSKILYVNRELLSDPEEIKNLKSNAQFTPGFPTLHVWEIHLKKQRSIQVDTRTPPNIIAATVIGL